MVNEFSNSKECPVKDLLYLIKQEDIDKLRQALLDVIYRNYPDSELYLYEQGYSFYDSQHNIFAPKLITCRSKNDNCSKKSELMQLASDSEAVEFDGFRYLPTEDYVQVFAVESERSSRGLLITVNNEVISEHYIYTLLSAYNHQVYLLRNKDTDSLTGLYNRQSFDSKLSKLHANFSQVNRADDQPSEFCFALIDIDFFKKVNDKYGHVYGDDVLLLFSNLMKETFRDTDTLFRYGGEEFAVLLNGVSLQQAHHILNRFRNTVSEYDFPLENKVTVSIGYTNFTDKIALATIIERADKALYYSKENGRNLASCYEDLVENNLVKDTTINEGDIELF